MEYFTKWLKEVNQYLPMIDDLKCVVKSYLPESYFGQTLVNFKNCVQTKNAIYDKELLALQAILFLHVNNNEVILTRVARIAVIHSQSCFKIHKERLAMQIRKAKADLLSFDCVKKLIDDFRDWTVFEHNEDKHHEFIHKLYVELFLGLWVL